MHSSSRMPLPFPLSLIASALVLAAALVLLGLAMLHWRHAGRLAPMRAHQVVVAWRMVGTAYALMGLGLLGLAGLSLAYPFDGRELILPPGERASLALEVVAYAMVAAGAVVMALGTVLLRRAYR